MAIQNSKLKTMNSEQYCTQPGITPPTDVTFWENLIQGNLQAAVWFPSLMESPPDVDFSLYGWHFDTSSSCLQPAFGHPDLILVPDNLLKIMRCGCKSGELCKGSREKAADAHAAKQNFREQHFITAKGASPATIRSSKLAITIMMVKHLNDKRKITL